MEKMQAQITTALREAKDLYPYEKKDFDPIEWVKQELDNVPESFDCFFEQSWDMLSEKEKDLRKTMVINLAEISAQGMVEDNDTDNGPTM
jgi:hypothetical protein